MRRLVRALIGVVIGYGAGALVCAVLLALLSGNTHDKSVEVAMTSAFVAGPAGAIVGCIWGLLKSGKQAGADPRPRI